MKKYIPLLFASFFILTGCDTTVYRLLYNSLDTIIYRSVTRYIDPGPNQDRFLREKIELHLQWHRRDQLPKYIVTLQGVRARMAAGIKKSDIEWMQIRFERHSEELYNAISENVAAFLVSLNRNQVDLLERKMAERFAEIEKKSLQGNEGRFREMEKSTVWIMELIYGPLTGRQNEVIASGVRQMENIEPERMRLYRERQREFISLLKNGPDKPAVKKYMTRLFIKPEKYYPEYYRGPAERQERMIMDAFARFDGELVTPEQRARALKKIDALIRVLGELAVEETGRQAGNKTFQ
jgi:hypothetical protein